MQLYSSAHSSGFALKNYESKNNSAYWQRKKYIGLGPSAHSFNGNKRIWNVSNNMKYINSLEKNKLPITIENLTEIDVYNEMVMTGLRTILGISLDDIEKQLGKKFKNYLLDKSKVKIDKKLIRPSKTSILKGNTAKAKKAFGYKLKTKLNDLIKIMMDSELKKYNG